MPESLLIGASTTKRLLDFQFETPGGCVAELRDLTRAASPTIRRIEFDAPPGTDCGVNQMVSNDGSTFVVWWSKSNGDDTVTNSYRFVRSTDGQLLRSASRVARPDQSLVLAPDGSRLVFTDIWQVDGTPVVPQNLEVIGRSANDDRSFDISGDAGRTCRAVQSFSAAAVSDIALLSCEAQWRTQAATIDLRTGRMWLSDSIPTSFTSVYSPMALSPRADQIIMYRAEFEFISIWPTQIRTIVSELGVIEAGSNGSGYQRIMDLPDGFSGLVSFPGP